MASVLLSACAQKPVKLPGPIVSPGPTAAATAPAAPSGARPDAPGEYTPGGLYKPGVADRGPSNAPDLSLRSEPVPKVEPRARYGNRSPYTVLGRSYHVMKSAQGYVQRGVASWYGEKFHGRATSSLEPYDMYAFSAAHKTLPLPTYARVTNLRNGRSVVVRVNDRGPFHEDRLIDLSYAAAVKLGMHDHGVAKVEVRALTPGEALVDAPMRPERRPASAIRRRSQAPVTTSSVAASTRAETPSSVARAEQPSSVQRPEQPSSSRQGEAVAETFRQTWIQVASFQSRDNAQRLVQRLEAEDLTDIEILDAQVRGSRVFRVRLGPVDGRALAERLAARVRSLGLGHPTLVAE